MLKVGNVKLLIGDIGLNIQNILEHLEADSEDEVDDDAKELNEA